MKIYWDRGLRLRVNGRKIGIDVKDPRDEDILLLSHAHSDHLPSKFRGRIICSNATREIINTISRRKIRENYSYLFEKGLEISMVDSGHILGSMSFLIRYKDRTLFYTGDFCDRERAFLQGMKIREFLEASEVDRVDTLVIESTYGSPYFIFPDFEDVVKEFRDWASENLSSGFNLVLLGYKVGKCQILSKITEGNFENVFVSEAVRRVNEVYEKRTDLKPLESIYAAANNGKLKEPFILICSPSSRKLLKLVERKFKVKKAIFTGFALDKSLKLLWGLDEAFPISDHADFKGLVKLVEELNPKRVLVTHGMSKRFASHLRSLGFNASPLSAKTIVSELFDST